MNRETYAKWGKETLDILEKGSYVSPSGKYIEIEKEVKNAVQNSKLYKPEEVTKLDDESSVIEEKKNTVIEITSETTLAASKRLLDEGYKVACLNFASAKNPGGGFLTGARAQEESLARSSALYPAIEQMKEMYDYNKTKWGFYSDYMVYSPDVPVFRNDNGKLEEEVYFVSMITSPAVNAGIILKKDPTKRKAVRGAMKERIRKILAVAKDNGEDVLVLGAFGCGVFGNAPLEVAKLFKEALEDERYKGHFKKVVFAIYESGTPVNKKAFEQVFK